MKLNICRLFSFPFVFESRSLGTKWNPLSFDELIPHRRILSRDTQRIFLIFLLRFVFLISNTTLLLYFYIMLKCTISNRLNALFFLILSISFFIGQTMVSKVFTEKGWNKPFLMIWLSHATFVLKFLLILGEQQYRHFHKF